MLKKEKVEVFTPDGSEVVMYFKPKDTARNYVIKHLGIAVDKRELFTPRVMDPLEDKFDEIIRSDFEFSSQDSEDHIDELLSEETED